MRGFSLIRRLPDLNVILKEMNTKLLVEVDAEFDRLAETGSSFWEFSERNRLLWAMACLRHHAGANGFRVISDYDEDAGFAVTAYMIYALRELGIDELSRAAEREWERLRDAASQAGIKIPKIDPRLTISELTDVQRLLQPTDRDWVTVSEPSEDDDAFVSIWGTDFAERVTQWISRNPPTRETTG